MGTIVARTTLLVDHKMKTVHEFIFCIVLETRGFRAQRVSNYARSNVSDLLVKVRSLFPVGRAKMWFRRGLRGRE